MQPLPTISERTCKRPRVHRPRPLPNLDTLPETALLTRAQVAELTGFALHTLKMWAKTGRGPQITVIEGRPRYRAGDVRAWLQPVAA